MRRCPLCHHDQAKLSFQDKKRSFYLCPECRLLFADSNSYLLPDAEKQRYGRARQAGKQKQLARFIHPLLEQLQSLQPAPLFGLNFGRVLSEEGLQQLNDAGHHLQQFDPFFAADHQLLHDQYDFICCFRVFEHFRTPAKEWDLIQKLIKPNGWLAISTPLLTSLETFPKWHYKNNPTHVSFYQQQTFAYLASLGQFKLIFAAQDFILMQKTSGSAITRDLNAEPPLVD